MIFLSYRTEDTEHVVDLLDARLTTEFGEDAVFRDRTRIDPGAPWAQVIDDNARSRKIMLAVIGPSWHLVRRKDGGRRARPSIRDPDDWVRREIAAAKQAGNDIIPVLVDGAAKPRARLLQESGLAFLFETQQAVLRSTAFDRDISELIEALTRRFPDLGPGFATFASDAEATHARTMADRIAARRRYGQALTLLAPDAHGRRHGRTAGRARRARQPGEGRTRPDASPSSRVMAPQEASPGLACGRSTSATRARCVTKGARRVR